VKTRIVELLRPARLGRVAALVLAVVAWCGGRAEAREPERGVVLEPPALTHALPPPLTSLAALARAGRTWRLDTAHGPVRVWIPAGYDAKTAAAVVFVHGYRTDVDAAWNDYLLPEQFALSGINAMFIVPEAPSNKHVRIAWPSLNALLATVTAGVDVPMPQQRLVAVGHSGAYRTLAAWLPNRRLDTVVLLDAVYGEYSFAPWVRRSPDHRLVDIAYETGRFCDVMHRWLPSTVRVEGLPREGFPDARIVYAKTDVGHWQLVTDGIALPLALRAIGVGLVAYIPLEHPLGLPARGAMAPPDAVASGRP
jgi:hypothetical protein